MLEELTGLSLGEFPRAPATRPDPGDVQVMTEAEIRRSWHIPLGKNSPVSRPLRSSSASQADAGCPRCSWPTVPGPPLVINGDLRND
jgi:hypothetical protein